MGKAGFIRSGLLVLGTLCGFSYGALAANFIEDLEGIFTKIVLVHEAIEGFHVGLLAEVLGNATRYGCGGGGFSCFSAEIEFLFHCYSPR